MFSEKQKYTAENAIRRFNILSGTMTSGKTYLTNFLYPMYLMGKYGNRPRGNHIILGRTQGVVRQNIINPILETFGSLAKIYRQEGLSYLDIGGEKVWFTGAPNERSYANLLGKAYASMYIDEATELPENAMRQVLGRLVGGGRAYLTTNPSSPYHWIYEEYIKSESPDVFNVKFGLIDNPTLTEEKIEELKRSKSGLFYKRYILGQWVAAEGVIYDMYSPERHIIAEPKGRILESNCFLDYGVGNPFVVMNIVKMENKDIGCLSEYSYDSREAGRQKTDDEYVKDIKQFYSNEGIHMATPLICDPSITYRFRNALNKAGFVVKYANNSVLPGISQVSTLLSRDKFWMLEGKCPGAEMEFSSYCWDLKAQQKGEDKPLKINDHRMDVIRYAANHYGRTPKRAGQGGSAV